MFVKYTFSTGSGCRVKRAVDTTMYHITHAVFCLAFLQRAWCLLPDAAAEDPTDPNMQALTLTVSLSALGLGASFVSPSSFTPAVAHTCPGCATSAANSRSHAVHMAVSCRP